MARTLRARSDLHHTAIGLGVRPARRAARRSRCAAEPGGARSLGRPRAAGNASTDGSVPHVSPLSIRSALVIASKSASVAEPAEEHPLVATDELSIDPTFSVRLISDIGPRLSAPVGARAQNSDDLAVAENSDDAAVKPAHVERIPSWISDLATLRGADWRRERETRKKKSGRRSSARHWPSPHGIGSSRVSIEDEPVTAQFSQSPLSASADPDRGKWTRELPHARRSRGAQGSDGGRDARLQRRAQVARGARGVPGLSGCRAEVVTVDLHARFRPKPDTGRKQLNVADRREAAIASRGNSREATVSPLDLGLKF